MKVREFYAEVERMRNGEPLPSWAKMPTGRKLLALILRYDVPTSHTGAVGYDEYLASPGWRKRRAVVLIMAHGMCWCGRQAWQVHHMSYERKGAELFCDLMPTCGNCHMAEHDLARARMSRMEYEQREDDEAPRLWWEKGY